MSVSYLFIVLPALSLIVGIVAGVIGYRKWRAKGIVLGIVVFGVLSVALVPTVIPAVVLLSVTNPSVASARGTAVKGMNEALFGANTILKRMPIIENAEQAIVNGGSTSDEATGCYHAWVDILYATSLDPLTFSDKLAQQLQTAGWISNEAKQPQSREFVQGENTRFSIEYGSDYAEYWKQQGYGSEYLSATARYSNTLNARIDYFVPSRAKCMP